MTPTLLIVLYCVMILLASLAGGWLPSFVRLTHERMQVMISFVAGLMLGVGLWHLLPHSAAELQSLDRSLWWTMIGLLTMFFLIRTFHFHQHDVEAGADDHGGEHTHQHGSTSKHQLSWLGIAFGLALHTMIDGVALAASVQAESNGATAFSLFGAATFFAIVLHKPLDALSITSLMAAGGWSLRARQVVNASFAMMCPIGVAIFYFSLESFVDQQHVIVGCALGFSAGVFLCISLADLLPEVQFHAHDRVKLSAALLLGIALAYGIGFLEPAGIHDHGTHEQGQTQHSHDTEGDERHAH